MRLDARPEVLGVSAYYILSTSPTYKTWLTLGFFCTEWFSETQRKLSIGLVWQNMKINGWNIGIKGNVGNGENRGNRKCRMDSAVQTQYFKGSSRICPLIQGLLYLRSVLRLWKTNPVSRKPCKLRSDLVLNSQMRVPKWTMLFRKPCC